MHGELSVMCELEVEKDCNYGDEVDVVVRALAHLDRKQCISRSVLLTFEKITLLDVSSCQCQGGS